MYSFDASALEGFASAKVNDIIRVAIKDVASGAQGSLKVVTGDRLPMVTNIFLSVAIIMR